MCESLIESKIRSQFFFPNVVPTPPPPKKKARMHERLSSALREIEKVEAEEGAKGMERDLEERRSEEVIAQLEMENAQLKTKV